MRAKIAKIRRGVSNDFLLVQTQKSKARFEIERALLFVVESLVNKNGLNRFISCQTVIYP